MRMMSLIRHARRVNLAVGDRPIDEDHPLAVSTTIYGWADPCQLPLQMFIPSVAHQSLPINEIVINLSQGATCHVARRHVKSSLEAMLKVLVLTTQKGGAGKTTLAASIAVAAYQDAQRLTAIDLDPQASLAAWGRRRSGDSVPVLRAEPADLKARLATARADGVDLAILDTPGLLGPAVTLALQEADLCLMPVRPSILDVEAARPTAEQIRRIGCAFAFVLNQANPASQARTLDAATALVATGALAPAMIATRSDFLDAMAAGEGVTETAPRGKAASEITLLWAWIKTRL